MSPSSSADVGSPLVRLSGDSRFSVAQVAESFLELVTDETKNGEALLVHANGTLYMEFPDLKLLQAGINTS